MRVYVSGEYVYDETFQKVVSLKDYDKHMVSANAAVFGVASRPYDWSNKDGCP